MYKDQQMKRTEEPCTEIELPHKIQANFATRVHNNLVRLLHRRSLKKVEQPKPGDLKQAPPGVQHKLIERLRAEEGLSTRKPLGNQLALAPARGAGSDPFKDISISVSPVRRGSLFMFPKFKPDVPALAQKMTNLSMNVMAAQRRSSTSTAFVKDTIANPNRSELLLCIAHALYYHMSTGMQTKVKIHEDIFSEKIHPMTREKPNFAKMPPMDTVYNFIRCLHEHAKSDHEVIIMSLAYIERLLEMSKITFDSTNWRRITLAAFIVADKAWNDLAVWNEDFLALFKGFVKIRDLNALEMKFLNLIQFKIFLKSSMYTKYYFELKAFSGMTPDQKLVALAPSKAEVQKDAAAKLIARQNRRSMSLDAYRPTKSKTIMVLN